MTIMMRFFKPINPLCRKAGSFILSVSSSIAADTGCTFKSQTVESTAAPWASTFNLRMIESVTDSVVLSQLKKGLMTGMSIAVARHGETIFTKGSGKAVLGRDVAATPETVFKIGTITKQITAAIGRVDGFTCTKAAGT